MQTVTVHTTQNIDIDYEVAGLGERILARLIDLGFFIALVTISAIIVLASSKPSTTVIIAMAIVGVSIFSFYDLVCEIFLNGQSFGKRIMKIKVISLNGGRPTIGQYLLRWLFRIVDFGITSSICALLAVAISEKKQRVGDMVAGTTLIMTKPRTSASDVVFAPVLDPDYKPTFTDVTQLTDNDIVLIHEVISKYNKTANTVLVYNMATRIKQHLSITTPPDMNDYKFLQTVLNDYRYLTAVMA
jgi:uncharacterized RDD family membrane protein YckC